MIVIVFGLPGSGKSTYAQSLIEKPGHKYKRINKDILRLMLDNDQWSPHNEWILNQMVEKMIYHYLRNGFHVISDNMNLSSDHIKAAVKIVNKLQKEADAECAEEQAKFTHGNVTLDTLALCPKYQIKVVDFNTDIELCIERDSKRPKPVGADVIRKIEAQWMQGKGLPNIDHILAKVGQHDGEKA